MFKKISKWEEAGQELEDFVESFYSALLKNEHLKNAKIEKNHTETGKSGIKYCFDIFHEVKIAGVSHKVAIECKNHNKKITKGMIQEFWGKLIDCNNITGFIVSTNGYEKEAKKLGKHYGIELITEDELPNMYKLFLTQTEDLVPYENVRGDPFWTIMQITEDGESTGVFYSLGGNIVNFLVPRPFWHGDRILLFISKKSAEMALKADGAKGYAVFGVSRHLLKGICYISKFMDCKIEIASKLRLEKNGELLVLNTHMIKYYLNMIWNNFLCVFLQEEFRFQ
jgi:hypothetical protein